MGSSFASPFACGDPVAVDRHWEVAMTNALVLPGLVAAVVAVTAISRHEIADPRQIARERA